MNIESASPSQLLPGTLDLLILKAVSMGPEHGYGVLLRLQALSRGELSIEQGSLYPALYRLEKQGFLASDWGTSDNNRRARFYSLSASGRRRLQTELASWRKLVTIMTTVLDAASVEA